MKILLIDNGTTFISELKSWFGPNDVTVEPFDKVSSQEVEPYDLVVLSGGHKYSINHHEQQYANELRIIKDCDKPVLGICLGFELIGYAYGCQLEKLEKKEKGIVEIELKNDEITKGLSHIKVYESHRFVIKNVGKQLLPIGTSKDGVEVIKHKNKPIYAFQFHPEIVVDKKVAKELLKNVLSALKK